MSRDIQCALVSYTFIRFVDYIKSLHYNENHWLTLQELSGGVFFHTDLKRRTLEFKLSPDIRVEIETHTVGKSSMAINSISLDDCIQTLSIKAWYPRLEDPVVYKWENGNIPKLKKEDRNWLNDVNCCKAIDYVLADIFKSYP